MIKQCFCGKSFDTNLKFKRYCCWQCNDAYTRLVPLKELFRLTQEELLLRDKALKFKNNSRCLK